MSSASLGSSAPIRLYYAALFVSFGAYLPYFPTWLEARGVSGLAMGAVAALLPAMGIVAPPLFGLLSDARALRGSLLRAASLGAALPFAVLAIAGAAGLSVGIAPLVGLVAIHAFFRAPLVPLVDVIALDRVRRGDDYGKNRLYGSIGFLAAALAFGRAVDVAAPAALPAAIACALAAAFALAWLLPKTAPSPPRPVLADGRALLAATDFKLFLAVSFLSQVAHASYDLCASLHLRDLGASGAFTGGFWALGVAGEVLLMAFAGPVLAKFGAPKLLAIGLLGAAIRWVGFAVVTSLGLVLALQSLHALSFALVWVASLAYLNERAAPHVAATAQGLFTAAVAVGSVVGMLVWGRLYQRAGGATVFAAAALVAAVAFAASLGFGRIVAVSGHRSG